MTAGAPWSVKGIDPKAREVAKDLARRSGMTLGEWLNRMILEDDPDDAVTAALFGARPPQKPQRPIVEAPPRATVQPSRYDGPLAARYEGASSYSREEVARVALALDRLTDHIEASETRTGLAINGVEQSVRAALSRLETSERQQSVVAARIEDSLDEVRSSQVHVAERLRRVEQEASGPRSAEALKALESALSKVAGRLDNKDDRTQNLLTRVESRIQRLEGGENESVAVVEDSFGKLSARLAEAEGRSAEAMEGLRDSFVALDGRLRVMESGGAVDQRLEELAANLGQRLDEVRVEIAAQLTASAEDRFDRMELKLGEMAEHVQAAEHRSAQAIEKMGQELAGVAETLGQRVQAAETSGARAMDIVGVEMARIGESVEARLARSDNVQAEALAKLSTEITRISERLTERISNAEQRSARAIDEVGEQVAKVSERMGQRADRAADDIAERIRASEERTAKLLEEAREKIDLRLAQAQSRLAEQVKAAAPPPPPVIEPALPPAEVFDEPAAQAPASAPQRARGLAIKPMFSAAFPVGPAAAPAVPPEPAFDDADFEAADGFAPVAAADGLAAPVIAKDDVAWDDEAASAEVDEDLPTQAAAPTAPPPALDPLAEVMKAIGAQPAAPTAARGVDAELMATPTLEPAPAFETTPFEPEVDDPFAASAAGSDAGIEPSVDSASQDPEDLDAAEQLFEPEPQPQPQPQPQPDRPLSARELIEQARLAARTAAQDPRKHKAGAGEGGGLFSSFSIAKPRRAGKSLPTAVLVAGGVAAASLAIGGALQMSGEPQAAEEAVSDTAAANPTLAAPRAAVAIAPKRLTEPSAPAASDVNVELLYAQAVQAIDGGEAGGLDKLKQAANLGHAPAQFYLAKLYEAGRASLKQDLAEARKWTERSAQGGERKAMHNLALYYFEGVGGPKNTTSAAQWFQRAAEMGLLDSQYNLGRLYEEGIGVAQNGAEAYRWYLIAARSGDGESRASAQRVKAQLGAEARVVAERSAASFRAAQPANIALAPDKAAIGTAQRALSRLGYYQLQGPADGVPSPALRMAIASFQRDQDLAPTGELDSLTTSRLAIFTR